MTSQSLVASMVAALLLAGCGPGRVARERGSTLGAFEVLEAQKVAINIEQLRVQHNWPAINAQLLEIAYTPPQRTQSPSFPFQPFAKPMGDLKSFKLVTAVEAKDYRDPKTDRVYQAATVVFDEKYTLVDNNVRTQLSMMKDNNVWKLSGVRSHELLR